jgi:hypothetical protein
VDGYVQERRGVSEHLALARIKNPRVVDARKDAYEYRQEERAGDKEWLNEAGNLMRQATSRPLPLQHSRGDASLKKIS